MMSIFELAITVSPAVSPQYLFDWATKISPIVTAATAPFISFQVQRYNIRRDKETIREKVWISQQAFNLECVKDPELIAAGEAIFIGKPSGEANQNVVQRAVYLTFIQINRALLIWSAWRSGIYTRSNMEDELIPMLHLLRNDRIFDYCLTRGYGEKFAADLRMLRVRAIASAPAPKPIFEALPVAD